MFEAVGYKVQSKRMKEDNSGDNQPFENIVERDSQRSTRSRGGGKYLVLLDVLEAGLLDLGPKLSTQSPPAIRPQRSPLSAFRGRTDITAKDIVMHSVNHAHNVQGLLGN